MMFQVYSKTNCPYCEAIEKVFKLKSIEYKKYLLNVDYSKEEFIEKFGEGTTFPRVLLNDELLGGAKETINYLKSQNMV